MGKKEKEFGGRKLPTEKIQVLMYDGSDKMTDKAWIQKLQTYFTLNTIFEEKAVQFASLQLEGLAYEWWQNGIVTQGRD